MTSINKAFLSAIILILFISAGLHNNPISVKQIIDKLNLYTQYRPQQKIYIQTDRPLYAPGEDIWFSLYMVDAQQHRLDSLSKVAYVEFFNDQNVVIQRHILYTKNGRSNGAFHLPDNLKAGNYSLRAYTNYMKNAGDDFFFIKEITIVTNEPRYSDERVDTTVDIQFFAEGGNFLSGVENRVAFKIADGNGNGISAQGNIVDENNLSIVSFKSEHKGMGFFRITPNYGSHYYALIKDRKVELPEVMQSGYLLRVMDLRAYIKVIAYCNLKNITSSPKKVHIVAQCRGQAMAVAEGTILNSTLNLNISKGKLPSGIIQITLFDDDGIPQCERLIFINHQKALQMTITPDSTVYSPRQKANVDIHVTNSGGEPTKGYFSMTVYDEAVINESNPYSNTINTSLLLTSDLKGKVEEPGYYLKDTSSLTKNHVDLLMMTNGWRRFAWKTVLSDTLHSEKYYVENGITISGRLLKTLSKQPSINSTLKIVTSFHNILVLKTDSAGRFYNDNLVYYDSTDLFIQTDNAKGRQVDLKLQLDPFNTPPPLKYIYAGQNIVDVKKFLDQTNTIKLGAHVTVLKAVEVKAKKEEINTSPRLYGMADATIKMSDVPPSYINIMQVLQGRVAGVSVGGGNPPSISIRGGGEPLYLLDGMQVDSNIISNISMSSVESIDVLKGVSASIYGGRGGNGVIAVYTKRGGAVMNRQTPGAHLIKYPGFYKAREFYTPLYDKPIVDDQPDIRNTLYWNPSITTNEKGNASVSFFTADMKGKYKVIIEGISKEGTAITQTGQIEVR